MGSTCARLLAQRSQTRLESGEYLLALTTNLVNNPAAADEFAGAVKMTDVMMMALDTGNVALLKIVNLVVKNGDGDDTNWTTTDNIASIGMHVSSNNCAFRFPNRLLFLSFV